MVTYRKRYALIKGGQNLGESLKKSFKGNKSKIGDKTKLEESNNSMFDSVDVLNPMIMVKEV